MTREPQTVAWAVQIAYQEKDFLQENEVTLRQITRTGFDIPILGGFQELTKATADLIYSW